MDIFMGLGGLGGNDPIFVDILGGLSGLGSLDRNVHIFVDILGGLSGLGSLCRNVHIFVDIMRFSLALVALIEMSTSLWTFWGTL